MLEMQQANAKEFDLRRFDITKPGVHGKVRIEHDDGILRLFLHDHEVLTYEEENDLLKISSGGWKTRTTRLALNTALSQLKKYSKFRVLVSNSKWILSDGPTQLEFTEGMVVTSAPYTDPA
jgi:hypothetical protein